MKILVDKIKSKITLSEEAEQYINSISRVKKFNKGHTLIREGQTVRHTFFVINGCLRSYCIDKKGREHTLQFAIKEWWISDFIAIYNNVPANLYIESVSDSEVIEFNTEQLHNIYNVFSEFEAFQRENLERHVVSLHKRILNQLQLSASERYDLFLQQYSEIEQLTPNYHIASYLGITEQSLSRIRAEKARK